MECELTVCVVGGACRKPSHCFGDLLNVSSREHKSGLLAVIRRPGGGGGDGRRLQNLPVSKGQPESKILINRESFLMELESYLDFHHQKRFGAVFLYPSVPHSLMTLEITLVLWWGKPPDPYERILKKFCKNYPESKISGTRSSSQALYQFHSSLDSTKKISTRLCKYNQVSVRLCFLVSKTCNF